MSGPDEEILREFLLESYENLDRLDREFVALETEPEARERIATIFRTIHTIKGTSGFIGFPALGALTHAGETLLSRLRDGELVLTPEVTTALLAMVDAVRAMLKNIEATTSEGTETYQPLIAVLDNLSAEPAPRAPPVVVVVAAEPVAPAPVVVVAPVAAAPVAADANAAHHGPNDARAAVSDTSIRVDVGLLDRLMNLVGELVLARNQVLQFSAQGKDAGFLSTTQRLNLITTELQEGVMKTRMQPIGGIWSKLPRVVRDLAIACGKQVRLEMEGEDTELDRTIIEAIKDPLTHIVRNSIDHGVETPELRIAAGKPAVGCLFLRAVHEGGQVNIEIRDDGAGIDPEKIRRKAIERGLISAERANQISDRELLNHIFLPGFSTAARVTNVSGRGVGMDVVKTNIEKIGGTVDVQSTLGVGTALRIKIPLTLAIVPALIVTSRGERFAIPQVSLVELVRLEADQARASVENMHGTLVYRLRGKLLPLVFLHEVLGLTGEGPADGVVNVVVVRADDRQFGLVVDGVSDTEEIVVKPLGKELKWLTTYAGATIMGDGRVALILDVLGIAPRSHAAVERAQRALTADAAARAAEDNRQSLLLFCVGEGTRMAIPLAMVARLEEFAQDRLERAGGQDVVQYRDEILPLVDLRAMFGAATTNADPARPLQVVVSTVRGHAVGLVVDQILDIVEENAVIKRRSGVRGVLGAAVIQGRVTEILDVPDVTRQAGVELPDLENAAA